MCNDEFVGSFDALEKTIEDTYSYRRREKWILSKTNETELTHCQNSVAVISVHAPLIFDHMKKTNYDKVKKKKWMNFSSMARLNGNQSVRVEMET